MLRGSVLLLALVFSAPTIWDAFGAQTVSVEAALIHYLVAVPVAAVLLGLVRLAMKPAPEPKPVPTDPQ